VAASFVSTASPICLGLAGRATAPALPRAEERSQRHFDKYAKAATNQGLDEHKIAQAAQEAV
jgi:hypothetical protein